MSAKLSSFSKRARAAFFSRSVNGFTNVPSWNVRPFFKKLKMPIATSTFPYQYFFLNRLTPTMPSSANAPKPIHIWRLR